MTTARTTQQCPNVNVRHCFVDRTASINVAPQSKDPRSLLWSDRVVDYDPERFRAKVALKLKEDVPAENIWTPRAAGEKAMKGFPMSATGYASRDERLRNRVGPLRQEPSRKDDDEVVVTWPRQPVAKALFPKGP